MPSLLEPSISLHPPSRLAVLRVYICGCIAWGFFPSFLFCVGPYILDVKVYSLFLPCPDGMFFPSLLLVQYCIWNSSLYDSVAETPIYPTSNFAPPTPAGSFVSALSALVNQHSRTGIPSCKIWLLSLCEVSGFILFLFLTFILFEFWEAA